MGRDVVDVHATMVERGVLRYVVGKGSCITVRRKNKITSQCMLSRFGLAKDKRKTMGY